MSEALERVIAEQQKEIDHLKRVSDGYCKSLDTVFTQHNKLFESIGRMVDSFPSANDTDDERKRYHKLACDVRIGLLEAGFCLGCYSFMCECDPDD